MAFGAMLAGWAVAGGAAAAAAAPPRFEPRAHHDAAEFPKDPLDLRAAAFGQVGTQLSLTLRTRRAWSAAGPSDDSLCVTLLRGGPVGQMCIAAGRARRPILRFRPARRGGGGYRHLVTVRAAAVESSGRTFRVLVYPRALGLRPGRFGWFVRSHLRNAACPRGCTDRLPDAGPVPLRVSVYGAPRCFGAAARAGRSPCVNPSLRRLVLPRPEDAELMHDSPCQPHRPARRYKLLAPCVFGNRLAGPTRLALVGDSHAISFRATAEVAAQALGLKSVSLTRFSCPFETERDPGWAPISESCRRHSRQVLRWLRAHPSVHMVMTTARAGRGYSEAGFRAMFRRIPPSVRRVYVVRDVPRATYRTADCVAAVRRRHGVSDGACPVPRSEALLTDPAAAAAAESGPRVHLIDLTRHFCDATDCFPVTGGAYVYRDTQHMNAIFAGTLGPYLLRAMRVPPA